MAKIQLSALVSNISGSIAGTTFATGANGLYVRNKGNMSNRNTEAMQIQRNNLAIYAGKWRGLPADARQSWKDAAPFYPYVDSLGQKKVYTGFQFYMKTLLNLEVAALDT